MMRIGFLIVCLLAFGQNKVLAQNLPLMEPQLSFNELNFSDNEYRKFKALQEKCNQIVSDFYNQENNHESLPKNAKKQLDECLEIVDRENYYDAEGPGCSFYCAAGDDTIIATSHLASSGSGTQYHPENIHDLNYETAWVEGVTGSGIGEKITYYFRYNHPRITEIKIANGYLKNASVWKSNNRVKQLKMYINDVPIAILNLKDSKKLQYFTFESIENSHNASEFESKTEFPQWTITFEIVDIYKGDKYDDTAITEIFFNGIGVH